MKALYLRIRGRLNRNALALPFQSAYFFAA